MCGKLYLLRHNANDVCFRYIFESGMCLFSLMQKTRRNKKLDVFKIRLRNKNDRVMPGTKCDISISAIKPCFPKVDKPGNIVS